MKLITLKNQFHETLSPIYGYREIESIFYIVAEHLIDKEKSILRMALNEEWMEFESKKSIFYYHLNDLLQGKPVQHIVGKAYFFDYKFFVDENVLIPRPETEELTEWILTDFGNKNKSIKILDIGTGSGCIAITLKKQKPNWQVTAIDFSEKALKLAEENSAVLNAPINFILFDLFSKQYDELDTFDIIVSNPPYITMKEKAEMNKNVVNFEPHSALFTSDQKPLIFYEEIIALAKNKLTENGVVYVEINQYLAEETRLLFEQHFKQVELKKDISGNYRMIKSSF